MKWMVEIKPEKRGGPYTIKVVDEVTRSIVHPLSFIPATAGDIKTARRKAQYLVKRLKQQK